MKKDKCVPRLTPCPLPPGAKRARPCPVTPRPLPPSPWWDPGLPRKTHTNETRGLARGLSRVSFSLFSHAAGAATWWHAEAGKPRRGAPAADREGEAEAEREAGRGGGGRGEPRAPSPEPRAPPPPSPPPCARVACRPSPRPLARFPSTLSRGAVTSGNSLYLGALRRVQAKMSLRGSAKYGTLPGSGF